MKPPFTVDYDEAGDCLYVYGSDNRSGSGITFPGGVVRFADDNGAILGVTLIGISDCKRPER
jgi:hypothetical protein